MRRLSDLRICTFFIGAPIFTLASISLLLTESFVANNLFIRLLVNFVGLISPVEHWVRDSHYPKGAALYHSIMFLTIPLWVVWAFDFISSRKEGILAKHRISVLDRCVLLIGGSTFGGLGVAAWVLFDGGDTRMIHFSSSKFDLAVGGWLFYWALTFLPVWSLASLVRVFRR